MIFLKHPSIKSAKLKIAYFLTICGQNPKFHWERFSKGLQKVLQVNDYRFQNKPTFSPDSRFISDVQRVASSPNEFGVDVQSVCQVLQSNFFQQSQIFVLAQQSAFCSRRVEHTQSTRSCQIVVYQVQVGSILSPFLLWQYF